MRHTSLTFPRVKLCKKLEVNSGPTHFLLFMNNGKAFPSLDGMVCSYQCPDQQASTRSLESQKLLDFLRPSKPNLLENSPNNTKNNKSKTKNKIKQKCTFVELLIPTLNKIISYHSTYFIGMRKS